MNTCKEHLTKIKRGETYRLTDKSKCVFCQHSPYYSDEEDKIVIG